MFAEIITIGDELLIGQVIDTNSAWIGKELNKIGIEVLEIVSVRDREDEILHAIDRTIRTVDLILVTGGLGPTKDDITKQALCKYFHTDLYFNEQVYENVKRLLGKRIPMNALNKDQAMVPRHCTVINNPVGTAPVCWFEKGHKILVSMPGVPQEMQAVMSLSILPKIQATFKTDVILHRTFILKNYAESVLAEKLETWESNLKDCMKVAYLPQQGVIRLRLTARGEEQTYLQSEMERQTDSLTQLLGDNICAQEDKALEKIIGDLLKAGHHTISTAESCTGGNIAARITSVPGSSGYFKGSIIAYANEVKTELLGVKPDTLQAYGAVSEQTVIEMVKGAINALKTDYAIATSGIAGPEGGTYEKPVGTIWIAVGNKTQIHTFKQESNRTRSMNIERACNNALIMLRNMLI